MSERDDMIERSRAAAADRESRRDQGQARWDAAARRTAERRMSQILGPEMAAAAGYAPRRRSRMESVVPFDVESAGLRFTLLVTFSKGWNRSEHRVMLHVPRRWRGDRLVEIHSLADVAVALGED